MKTRVLVYGLGTEVGGIEEYLLNIYRHIDKEQIAFDIIPHGGNKFYAEKEITNLGGEIYPVFDKNHKLSLHCLNEVLRRERPRHQVMYLNLCTLYRISPFILAKKHHYPMVVHSHNTEDPNRSPILRQIHKINRISVRNWTDSCFACSSAAGEWLFGKKFFHEQQKCSIIRNAIDLDKFVYDMQARKQIRKEFKIDEKEDVYLTVGRLVDQKNQQYSIDVFAVIARKHPQSRLILVGDGPNLDSLMQRAQNLGITDKIIFTGSRNDVDDIMSAADLLLMPSLYEGLGIVAIEAQASGLPVLASDQIPDEAMVLPSIMHRLKTKTSVDVDLWSEQAFSMIHSNGQRKGHKTELSLAGYDINLLAENMLHFFQKYNQEHNNEKK